MKPEFIFVSTSSLIENEFPKLIKIGSLSWEVDEKGLTSKFLITLLGRKVSKESLEALFTKKK